MLAFGDEIALRQFLSPSFKLVYAWDLKQPWPMITLTGPGFIHSFDARPVLKAFVDGESAEAVFDAYIGPKLPQQPVHVGTGPRKFYDDSRIWRQAQGAN